MKMLIEGSSDCSNGRWSSRSPLRRASKRVFPKSPEQAQMPSPFRSRGGRRINAEGPCLISDLLRGALKSERLSAFFFFPDRGLHLVKLLEVNEADTMLASFIC